MASYRLISFDLCPFVQRTQVMLREKGVDFDIDYVDLSSKADWFVALSPTSKVPTPEVTGEYFSTANCHIICHTKRTMRRRDVDAQYSLSG